MDAPDERCLEALVALTRLEDLPRTGWLQAGIRPAESIAGHSHGAALVALALGPRIEPPVDLGRVLGLLVVHDGAEALLGDWPRAARELLPAGAKAEAENRAGERLLGPLSDLARDLGREYQAQTTREARFARLCDKFQLGLRLLVYRRAGWRGLDEFEHTVQDLDCTEFAGTTPLHTALIRALAAAPN